MKAIEILQPAFADVIGVPVGTEDRLYFKQQALLEGDAQSLALMDGILSKEDLTMGDLVEAMHQGICDSLTDDEYWEFTISKYSYETLLEKIDQSRQLWRKEVVDELERMLNNRYHQHMLTH